MTKEIATRDGDESLERSEQSDRPEVYEVDSGGVDTEQLTRDLVHVMWDQKALNPVAIDLRGLVAYTDFIIVCTGQSERHVRAIGKNIEKEMKEAGWTPVSVEGIEAGRWAVLDFGDVVVHVFNGVERDQYDLEGMWADADRLEFQDPPEELYGHFQADRFES